MKEPPGEGNQREGVCWRPPRLEVAATGGRGRGVTREQRNPTRGCGRGRTHCFDNLGESLPIGGEHVAAADRPIRDGSARKERARGSRRQEMGRKGGCCWLLGMRKADLTCFPPDAVWERKCNRGVLLSARHRGPAGVWGSASVTERSLFSFFSFFFLVLCSSRVFLYICLYFCFCAVTSEWHFHFFYHCFPLMPLPRLLHSCVYVPDVTVRDLVFCSFICQYG